jgi:hypothetical protein
MFFPYLSTVELYSSLVIFSLNIFRIHFDLVKILYFEIFSAAR